MSEKIEVDSTLLKMLEDRKKRKEAEDRFNETICKLGRDLIEEVALNELEREVVEKTGEKGAMCIKMMRIMRKYGVPFESLGDCLAELVNLYK